MGLLDGKIAIITGAGGGIGRCYALAFAAEGAKVVVNDLGGTRDGVGSDQAMASQVVKEIEAAGGSAVANFDSVANFEGVSGLFKTALDAYGRVDVLINNAGILRDKTLLKMEEAMWDAVIEVHLKGTFLCTQAFARHVKERAEAGDKGGIVVNTSSYAGLIGNYGQSNYGAAKAGIAGLTRVAALEMGGKLGIRVNCIAPMAKTRMTEDISMVPAEMTPEQVAPMALFLASELSKDITGRVFGVHGQQLLEYKNLMSEGVTKEGKALWSATEIASSIEAISALEKAAPATADAAPLGPGAVIDVAFSRLPELFLAPMARNWNARLVFDIEGANPWSILVKDKTCTTQKGKVADPTCVVTTDAETYAAVLKGELKPDKAFMAGKIKATNLGDVMKFATAFDMKKAKAIVKEMLSKPAAAAPAAKAAAPAGPGAVIDQAFTLLPEVFLPARAKGWTATIHFDIGGADPWSVLIADGTCTTLRGKEGEPSCVVSVDAETYAAVIKGELKPDKAFMSGKIKATNLGDMMKFATAFDMKKAREVAKRVKAGAAADAPPAAGASGPATGPQGLVDSAFTRLPSAFRPKAVSDWSARVHFDLKGGEGWTVSVEGGACQTSKGLEGQPTCVVTVSLADYAEVLQGKLRAETAFMEKRIKASNMGEMLKFGRAFDLVSLQKELQAMAPAAPSADEVPPGMNRDLIGKGYTGREPQFVKPEHIALFAEATQDERPAYAGEEAVAPPLLAVRLLKDVLFRVVGDEDLRVDMLNLVHGEQDMEFLRPLRPWDLCATRARVTGIDDKGSGQLLSLEEEVWAGGELAVRVKASMFIRDPSKSQSKGKGASTSGRVEQADPAPTFQRSVTIPADAGPRYAEASLDNNPIHTDPEVASLAGFPGIILQGLCTMAMAGAALVDELAGGDPARLKRLKVRFTKPVLMGDVLTTEGWKAEGEGAYGFRVVNQDGVVVVASGRAEVGA